MAALVASLATAVYSAPVVLTDACYVRPEPLVGAEGKFAVPVPTQSFIGLRRKATRLVEVELSVVGRNAAVCTVSGIAKVRGAPGQELLVLPIRPDVPARSIDSAPCLLYIEGSASAIDISTSEPACRAQAPCGGQVALHGQRFDVAGRVASGGPCFARADGRSQR